MSPPLPTDLKGILPNLTLNLPSQVPPVRGILPNPSIRTPPTVPLPIQPKPLYFSKWSRKYVDNAINNLEATSVFVENIPARWLPTDIHLFLSKFGDILDVFLPNKLTKSGLRFGFVRFRCSGNINHIVDNINKVSVENGFLKANVARSRKSTFASTNPSTRTPGAPTGKLAPHQSYAQVVSKVTTNSAPPVTDVASHSISFSVPNETVDWLSCCTYGVLKAHLMFSNLHSLFSVQGFHNVSCKLMGGRSV
ncbi:hypothetical protein Tsubulata_021481 [Turnera subulata]|uniref:RRM domain-containing protein n=1 Tax=Turnera subulata TaxID=218843 RepID=A0A9Q0F026_9ROSI|nr:hypothetical protein Tsubulata_021481 [Turnera subulata]